MDEPKVAEQSVVETETTQANPPQAEESVTSSQTEVTTEQALPDANEEQRKAFQEMRLENKRLKEEMEARQTNESAFKAFRPAPQVQSFSSEQFTDPVTGEINVNALLQAQEASITAKLTRQQEERLAQDKDETEARTKFPELFSDPDIEQDIADSWFAAKMRGQNPTVKEIAAKYAKKFGKAVTKAEIAGAEKALQEVAPKEQAALSVSGQSSTSAQREVEQGASQELISSVRYGSDDALAEAMSKIPWANK